MPPSDVGFSLFLHEKNEIVFAMSVRLDGWTVDLGFAVAEVCTFSK